MRDFLQAQSAGLPGEVTIQVSPLDPNNQLPACAALEPFLPAGTRAWGRISVGVRCDSPVTWTAYVQAQVSVIADYLVAARPLRAGQIVGPADLGQRRGDLTALADNILTDSTQAMGHHTRFAVAAGTPLRGDMLRVPHAVRQGQTVRVLGVGAGFRVASEGRAMNNAAPGERVRVRLADGQVVTGTAQAGGADPHYASIRAGDIVGEHLVQFAGQGERIELVHRAMDRDIFARGALQAAAWLADKPPGLYVIADLLSDANGLDSAPRSR